MNNCLYGIVLLLENLLFHNSTTMCVISNTLLIGCSLNGYSRFLVPGDGFVLSGKYEHLIAFGQCNDHQNVVD